MVVKDALGNGGGQFHRFGHRPGFRVNSLRAFSEGQMVKNGDLLFEIDPRPFQAQRSPRPRDNWSPGSGEALVSAQRDASRYATLFIVKTRSRPSSAATNRTPPPSPTLRW